MYQYISQMQHRCRNDEHVHIQLDGTTLSGIDLIVVANYSVEREQAMWFPVQELLCSPFLIKILGPDVKKISTFSKSVRVGHFRCIF